MDPSDIAGLNKRLSRYAEEIEQYKKDYTNYSKQEIELTKLYTLEEAKKGLEFKVDASKYKIVKPTKEDLERILTVELEDLKFRIETAKSLKELAWSQYKMTETQISTIQSRLGYAKAEMSLI